MTFVGQTGCDLRESNGLFRINLHDNCALSFTASMGRSAAQPAILAVDALWFDIFAGAWPEFVVGL